MKQLKTDELKLVTHIDNVPADERCAVMRFPFSVSGWTLDIDEAKQLALELTKFVSACRLKLLPTDPVKALNREIERFDGLTHYRFDGASVQQVYKHMLRLWQFSGQDVARFKRIATEAGYEIKA